MVDQAGLNGRLADRLSVAKGAGQRARAAELETWLAAPSREARLCRVVSAGRRCPANPHRLRFFARHPIPLTSPIHTHTMTVSPAKSKRKSTGKELDIDRAKLDIGPFLPHWRRARALAARHPCLSPL